MKLTNSSFTIFTICLSKQKIDPARGEKRRPDIQKRVKKGDKKNVQQERKCRNLRCYVVNFPWFFDPQQEIKRRCINVTKSVLNPTAVAVFRKIAQDHKMLLEKSS